MMEKEKDMETKYQKLAIEYSKVRSQATVLKKGLLDEQSKNTELCNMIKAHEQTIRKREQEMESLTFRNDQLTKRIMVLQLDLQANQGKKSKNRTHDSSQGDVAVFNEELQKKIEENAKLLGTILENESEITDCKENIKYLEDMVAILQKELQSKDLKHKHELENYIKENKILDKKLKEVNTANEENQDHKSVENINYWKNQAEMWKSECRLLKCKPDSPDKLTEYYEKQLCAFLEKNTFLQSEVKTLWAENKSLTSRLENNILKYNELKVGVDLDREELITANRNYQSQLDAMTEHLAAQNEKITNQCDDIQALKHRLSIKK